MKVLYSINRPHTDNIKSGRKLWEIRKTKPNIPVPFTSLIYETKKKGGCGKVIGEFICDEIKEIKADNAIQAYFNNTHETCLTDTELRLYATKGKPLYGLHISDLKIYDKPKDISEFKTVLNDKDIKCKYKEQRFKTYNGKPYYRCNLQNCVCEFRRLGRQTDCDGYELTRENKPLTRPPQSWCYVEE